MKHFKKFISLLIVFTLCFSMAVPTMAENSEGVTYTATLDKDTIDVSAEDQTVVMTVRTNKEVDVDALGMTVVGDLTITAINNSVLGFKAGNSNLSNGKVNYATEDAENMATNVIVEVTYAVPANTPAGTYTVGIEGLNISKDYGEEWEDDASAYATLTIKEAAPEVTVTGIEVYSEDHKIEYTVGDALDVSELTILVTKSDDSTEKVEVTEDMVSGFDSTTAGEKELTITYEGQTTTYVVTVKPATVAVEGVTLSATELKLEKGETAKLTATVTPDNATDKTVTWKSSNESVAKVDEEGNVVAVGEGEATITATAGEEEATCVVTVLHKHVGEEVEGKEATCEADGWEAYYECACGKFFEDAECTKEIADLDAWKAGEGRIEGHDYTTVEEKESTCKEQGWDAYKTCENCDKLFDANSGEEIDEIPYRALADCKPVKVKDDKYLVTEGTCQEEAVYNYSCEVCGEALDDTFFGDKDADNHVKGTKCVDNNDGETHSVVYECCPNVVVDESVDHKYVDGKCACGAVEPAETYEVTVVNGKGSGDYEEGAEVTIEADAAEEGKEFDKWVVVSGEVELEDETAATTTFEMPAEAVKVEATYKDVVEEPTTYTVTVVNGEGSGDYEEGAEVTIEADAAEEGKEFDKWVVVSGEVELEDETAATTTFEMPAEAVKVEATYKDAEGGEETDEPSITLNTTSAKLTVGETKELTVTVTPEGTTVTWTSSDEDVATVDENGEVTAIAEGTATITATITVDGKVVSETCEITVEAKADDDKETFTVTVINGSGDGDYEEGDKVIIKAQSKSGYKFKGWVVNEGDVELDDEDAKTTFFYMPDEDVEIEATYKKESSSSSKGGGGGSTKYSITVEDTENGDVKLNRTSASKGTTVTITATPDKGYEVEDVVATAAKDGKNIEVTDKGDGKYTFVMPSSKVEVKVEFKAAEVEQEEQKVIILTINEVIAWVFDEYVVNDVAPIIRNERTMLPARFVAEALGGTVSWDEATQKVTIVKGETTLEIFIGEPFAVVNGTPVQLDCPAFIENSRTYLPLRFIAENLGATVAWDGVAQTITITPGK